MALLTVVQQAAMLLPVIVLLCVSFFIRKETKLWVVRVQRVGLAIATVSGFLQSTMVIASATVGVQSNWFNGSISYTVMLRLLGFSFAAGMLIFSIGYAAYAVSQRSKRSQQANQKQSEV